MILLDMKMPDGCAVCPICCKAITEVDVKSLILGGVKRLANCPLKELPEEYSKLIDADELDNIRERAEKYRQLAEWLKELKQLREQESKDELKDLSKRVENIEKKIKEDKEEQLKRLQAEIEYAKFRCALKEE